MNNTGGFLMGLNGGPVRSHGSVEDLIKSTLGGNFRTLPAQNETVNPIQTTTKLPTTEDVLENIDESLSFVKNSSLKKMALPKKSEVKKIKKESTLNENLIPEKQEQVEPVFESEVTMDYERSEPEIIRRREYIFHRDSDETFECKVTVEGGSPEKTIARLILKTDTWNLVFEGVVRRDGTCIVPLKKLSLFADGTIGEARLEIVVDDVMFTPWESPFKVGTSKRVSMETVPSINRR